MMVIGFFGADAVRPYVPHPQTLPKCEKRISGRVRQADVEWFGCGSAPRDDDVIGGEARRALEIPGVFFGLDGEDFEIV